MYLGFPYCKRKQQKKNNNRDHYGTLSKNDSASYLFVVCAY